MCCMYGVVNNFIGGLVLKIACVVMCVMEMYIYVMLLYGRLHA